MSDSICHKFEHRLVNRHVISAIVSEKQFNIVYENITVLVLQLLRVLTKKFAFLFLNQNICCGIVLLSTPNQWPVLSRVTGMLSCRNSCDMQKLILILKLISL